MFAVHWIAGKEPRKCSKSEKERCARLTNSFTQKSMTAGQRSWGRGRGGGGASDMSTTALLSLAGNALVISQPDKIMGLSRRVAPLMQGMRFKVLSHERQVLQVERQTSVNLTIVQYCLAVNNKRR